MVNQSVPPCASEQQILYVIHVSVQIHTDVYVLLHTKVYTEDFAALEMELLSDRNKQNNWPP